MKRGSPLLVPWISLAGIVALFSISPVFRATFWTPTFLQTLLQQAATNVILAVGMTFVIISGGIDLSVGSSAALCGVALALSARGETPPFLAAAMGILPAFLLARWAWNFSKPLSARTRFGLSAAGFLGALAAFGALAGSGMRGGLRTEGAILACLATGAGIGTLNGLAVSLGRVPPFVATLGMLTAARGLTLYATEGESVSGLPPRLMALGQGWPVLAIAGTVALTGWLMLSRSNWGRAVYAAGGSEESARLSGIDLVTTRTAAYASCSLCAAVAAVVLTAKFRVADTGAFAGAELNAIAAVVLGGTSLAGGQGSIGGAIAGALTIATLSAGMVILGVRDVLQGVVIGAVIVGAVMLGEQRHQWRALLR